MKIIFFVLWLVLAVLEVNGQGDYLTPCVDFSNTIISISLYQSSFNKTINNKFNEDYLLRFIAQPSFTPEYAVQVSKKNENYYEIEIQIFRENYWESVNRDSVEVDFFYKELDKDIALRLDILFDKATADVHSRDASGSGLDGERYYFYRKSAGEVKCGTTWSPNKGSPLGRLITICNDLTQYSLGNNVDLCKLKDEIAELSSMIK